MVEFDLDVGALARTAAERRVTELGRSVGELDRQLLRRLDQAYDTAVRQQLPVEQFRGRAAEVARRFGLDEEIRATTLSLTRDEIGVRSFHRGSDAVRESPEGRIVWPYVRYTIRGVNTRPNHAALDGLVWRSGSEIEPVVIPPNGWNCFCRPVPVPAAEAQRLSFEGDLPLGDSRLRAFLALGGHDEGFPKERFVRGATRAAPSAPTAAEPTRKVWEDRSKTTIREAADWWDTGQAAWEDSLELDERGAVEWYSGDGFFEVNKQLRSGTIPEANSRFIRALDRALERDGARVPGDVTVWRSTDGKFLKRLNIGDEFVDRGFVSTSAVRSRVPLGSVVAEIRLREGQRGAWIGNISREPTEMEVLLPRGQRYRVVEIKRSKSTGTLRVDQLHLVLEIVDDQ